MSTYPIYSAPTSNDASIDAICLSDLALPRLNRKYGTQLHSKDIRPSTLKELAKYFMTIDEVATTTNTLMFEYVLENELVAQNLISSGQRLKGMYQQFLEHKASIPKPIQ